MKKSLRDRLMDAVTVLAGTAVLAAGLAVFTIPNDIAPGGVSGLATALAELIDHRIGIGVLSLLLNVPLFFVAGRILGVRPLVTTLAATVVLSVFIDAFCAILPTYTNNVLLAAGLGGVLCGAGMGLLFVRGASTGGTDLLSLLLHRSFPNLSVSTLLLCVDAAVVLLAVIVFQNVEVALYSIVTLYVASKVIDGIMQGVDFAKVIYVVTERGEAINERLVRETECGVTVLNARGGYTGREKQLLMVITRRRAFAEVLGVIKSVDKAAFLFVSSATEVHGEGFKAIE